MAELTQTVTNTLRLARQCLTECLHEDNRFRRVVIDDIEAVLLTAANAEAYDTWDAPTCLRWLGTHVTGANHCAERAEDWGAEVARFAAYEHVPAAEWDAQATDELRAAVRAEILGDTEAVS